MKNTYKSALNKLTLSQSTKEIIIMNTMNKSSSNKKIKWMIPAGAVAILSIVMLSMIATQKLSPATSVPLDPPPVEVVNPIVDTSDIDSLKELLNFTLHTPSKLPDGYIVEKASAIDGTLAQIIYTNETDSINFRSAEGSDDISGDYTKYETTIKVIESGQEVTLKSVDTGIQVVTWCSDELSYSIKFSTPVDEATVLDIVEHVK